MTRTIPTLVVIDSPGDGRQLPRCLEGIVAGLGNGDAVVVLSAAPERARRHATGRRVSVQAHPGNGLGARLAELAVDADRLVVVADDAVAAHRSWLSELSAVLHAASDGAPIAVDGDAAAPTGHGGIVAPLTNGAAWPQAPLDVPDAGASRSEISELARTIARDGGRGQSTDAARLGGPVLALDGVAAAKLSVASGRTVRELAAHLGATGATLRLALGAYVHATASVPLVSGCLIVKDEAADLADCLATIIPLVDEVVVYDTGSTDDSVAIARAAGATVVEGAWHDDFARARNEAMNRARGTWVFSIDADERLESSPTELANLRSLLAGSAPVDRYIIPLYDLLGSIHAPVRSADGKPMARLFRRRRCQWEGAIHEQPNARPRTPAVRNERLDAVSFLHRGYLDEIVAEKGKWARNLRVAVGSMPSLPTDAKGCYDLGRSLHSTGYRGEALSLFERAVEIGDNEVIVRAALQFMVQTLLELGLAEDAEARIDQLRAVSGTDHVARYLEGWLRVEQGRWADAITALDGLVDYNDTFTSYTEDRRLTALALARRGAGDRVGAATVAILALASNPQAAQAWSVLVDTLDAIPDALAQVAATVPTDRLLPTFLTLGQFPVDVRDQLADELWQLRPGDLTVVALASQFAVEVASERMAVWAGRLRSLGLASLCPVAKVAQDGARTVDERVMTVATALHLLEDDDLRETLEALVPLVLDDALDRLLDHILTDLVGAAECFIMSAATSGCRTLRLIEPLVVHGHLGEALTLVDHATDLDAAASRRWIEGHGALARRLRTAAAELGRTDLLPVLDQAA